MFGRHQPGESVGRARPQRAGDCRQAVRLTRQNGTAASAPRLKSSTLGLGPAIICHRARLLHEIRRQAATLRARPVIGLPALSSRQSTGAPARPSSVSASDSDAKAVVYEEVSAAAVVQSAAAQTRVRIALSAPKSGETSWAELAERNASDAQPRAGAEAWSIMLYTSGTTAKPKGVPRRQRAERAAAVARLSQKTSTCNGERTLGVMPLYHTMGVRSLLAMSLIRGHLRMFAALRLRRRAGADRSREDHQSLSGADALSRSRPTQRFRQDRRLRCTLSSASPALR